MSSRTGNSNHPCGLVEVANIERIIGVASNPDLRPRGLPDEPRAAKPKSLTRSKKNLLDKVAGEKLEVATARSKRRPLVSLPSPGTTQIYSINPDLNQERISELHLRRHREDHGDDDEKRRKQGAPATAKGHGSHRSGE
ncbi:hypothetical protein F2Q70_00015505 [Brassica cretica]|uniref:Uncharacterized protein n=1 Tax=Brassica cretica TaxID=69181 RepID=A0A8S9HQC7_BRACR|nr:hypothetical protein F2Q70_00015505 [Brassica cretica]